MLFVRIEFAEIVGTAAHILDTHIDVWHQNVGHTRVCNVFRCSRVAPEVWRAAALGLHRSCPPSAEKWSQPAFQKHIRNNASLRKERLPFCRRVNHRCIDSHKGRKCRCYRHFNIIDTSIHAHFVFSRRTAESDDFLIVARSDCA